MAGHVARSSQVEVGDGVAQAPVVITTITVTNNIASIQATSHGFQEGDVILIDSIVSPDGLDTSLNNLHHMVRFVDADNFDLPGTYAEGTYTSGGNATHENTVYARIASVRDGNSDSQADEVDVSDIDSPFGFREFEPGMKGGTWALNLNYRPNEASHGAVTGLRRLFNSGATRWLRQTYPQVSTIPPRDAVRAVFNNFGRTYDMERRLELTVGGRTAGLEVTLPGV